MVTYLRWEACTCVNSIDAKFGGRANKMIDRHADRGDFTVSVNVYFRLTHVFSIDTLLYNTLKG